MIYEPGTKRVSLKRILCIVAAGVVSYGMLALVEVWTWQIMVAYMLGMVGLGSPFFIVQLARIWRSKDEPQ